MQKLSALGGQHAIRLTNDDYDPETFGGTTALQIFVDDLRLEINTRDPNHPYEIELGRTGKPTSFWRASYAKDYLSRSNAIEIDPPGDLFDWLIGNWDTVYHLICNSTTGELADFESFSKMLDQKRHEKMVEAFRQSSLKS